MTKVSTKNRRGWKPNSFEASGCLKLVGAGIILLVFLIIKNYMTLLRSDVSRGNLNSNLYPDYKKLEEQRRKSKPAVAFFNGGTNFIDVPVSFNEKRAKNPKQYLRNKNESSFFFHEHKLSDPPLLLLEHEHLFMETLRSCTNSKCFHKTDSNGIYRVGVLAPPGAIGDTFFSILNEALDSIFDPLDSPQERKKIQLIRTTHVPPYGYGGNHGWTKIIRLLSTPLPIAIADVMIKYQNLGTLLGNDLEHKVTEIGHEDILLKKEQIQTTAEAILRQIVRFQARLSHVAAHTTLLTVDISSMELDYKAAFTNILNFLIRDNEGNSLIQTKNPKLNVRINLKAFNDAIYNADKYSSDIISSLWQVGILEDILREEMAHTDNLKAWPSQSFWNMGTYIIDDEKSIPYQAAKAMIPDCEDEYVRCTIKKDICEVNAQVQCK